MLGHVDGQAIDQQGEECDDDDICELLVGKARGGRWRGWGQRTENPRLGGGEHVDGHNLEGVPEVGLLELLDETHGGSAGSGRGRWCLLTGLSDSGFAWRCNLRTWRSVNVNLKRAGAEQNGRQKLGLDSTQNSTRKQRRRRGIPERDRSKIKARNKAGAEADPDQGARGSHRYRG